ncbi:MAG: hypothetical protein US42_C0006G0055 [Candidatus Magasanikbacteria bacterium GW2011_GWC2_37_14]|uniref:Uncharacterized protein n=1 Tax=Candidatus Magasanikbacteria bacterium GW2011_GWC2_37_14 TaxID=1619046 RepID=A0A0G0G9H5_9BACT|nr:MAG: hypothetical protein US42_C0006G0055 [Candidatus Magasanikbacteria bacterium GW2011_GWC2_37_14]
MKTRTIVAIIVVVGILLGAVLYRMRENAQVVFKGPGVISYDRETNTLSVSKFLCFNPHGCKPGKEPLYPGVQKYEGITKDKFLYCHVPLTEVPEWNFCNFDPAFGANFGNYHATAEELACLIGVDTTPSTTLEIEVRIR